MPIRGRSGRSWRDACSHPWALAAALVCLAPLAMLIDLPVAQWCLRWNCPGDFRKLVSLAEPFGHGFGVLVVAALVRQMDVNWRRSLACIVLGAVAAGLSADAIKLLVHRTRPHSFDFQGGVSATFEGWLPMLEAGSHGQSFPSGHAATAVALAYILATFYPSGRGVFISLGLLAICQRIVSGAHFVSDTLCGAAVGILAASIVVSLVAGRSRQAAVHDSKPGVANAA